MSGRTYANNVNGRGNGAAGRGSGNPQNYGANAVPGTSSLEAQANAYYYRQTGHPYPVGPSMTGAQYYGSNTPMVGMWQQSPPTGSTHGAATSTPSGAAPTNTAIPAGTTPYPHASIHAIPITSNQPQYIQGYRPAMPQHALWPMPQGYMSPAPIGMMTSTAPPHASFTTPSNAASSVQPRQKRILQITVGIKMTIIGILSY